MLLKRLDWTSYRKMTEFWQMPKKAYKLATQQKGIIFIPKCSAVFMLIKFDELPVSIKAETSVFAIRAVRLA